MNYIMKTEKISKLIDNAEGIRGEICEGFRKRIEELLNNLKRKESRIVLCIFHFS